MKYLTLIIVDVFQNSSKSKTSLLKNSVEKQSDRSDQESGRIFKVVKKTVAFSPTGLDRTKNKKLSSQNGKYKAD